MVRLPAALALLAACAAAPAPAHADGAPFPVTLTCAGLTAGTMADGAAPHPYAAAAWQWPFGTRLQDDAGRVWTVEDRPALATLGGLPHVDEYLLTGAACRAFGVRPGRLRVVHAESGVMVAGPVAQLPRAMPRAGAGGGRR